MNRGRACDRVAYKGTPIPALPQVPLASRDVSFKLQATQVPHILLLSLVLRQIGPDSNSQGKFACGLWIA